MLKRTRLGCASSVAKPWEPRSPQEGHPSSGQPGAGGSERQHLREPRRHRLKPNTPLTARSLETPQKSPNAHRRRDPTPGRGGTFPPRPLQLPRWGGPFPFSSVGAAFRKGIIIKNNKKKKGVGGEKRRDERVRGRCPPAAAPACCPTLAARSAGLSRGGSSREGPNRAGQGRAEPGRARGLRISPLRRYRSELKSGGATLEPGRERRGGAGCS